METLNRQTFMNGEEKSTSCMEAPRAKQSASPEKETATATTVGSGERCIERYGKSGPVGLLSKMLLTSPIWYHPSIRLAWMRKQVMRLKEDDSCSEGKSSRISSATFLMTLSSSFS